MVVISSPVDPRPKKWRVVPVLVTTAKVGTAASGVSKKNTGSDLLVIDDARQRAGLTACGPGPTWSVRAPSNRGGGRTAGSTEQPPAGRPRTWEATVESVFCCCALLCRLSSSRVARGRAMEQVSRARVASALDELMVSARAAGAPPADTSRATGFVYTRNLAGDRARLRRFVVGRPPNDTAYGKHLASPFLRALG